MNSLQFEIPGKRVLDLFAGSGALGFEALSRGASFAAFLENNDRVCDVIRDNQKSLEVQDRSLILPYSVEALWNSPERISKSNPYDFVFADPPYGLQWEDKLITLPNWELFLSPSGTLLIEWSEKKKELANETRCLVKVKEKSHGEVTLTSFKLKDQINLK